MNLKHFFFLLLSFKVYEVQRDKLQEEREKHTIMSARSNRQQDGKKT